MNGSPPKDLSVSNLQLHNLLTGCFTTVIKAPRIQTCELIVGEATVDSECARFPQGVCTSSISGLSPIQVQDNLVINQGLQIPNGAISGFVLTADSTGNASWQPGGGGGGSLVTGTITNAQPGGTTVSNVVCQRIGRVAVLQFDWVQTVAGGPYVLITFDDPSFFPVSNMLILGFRDTIAGGDTQEFRCQLRTTGDVFLPFFGTTTGGETVTFIASYFTV